MQKRMERTIEGIKGNPTTTWQDIEQRMHINIYLN